MKVHKMSTKQFAKFVSGMQEQAMKNGLYVSYRSTDKYDYECKTYDYLCNPDWRIRRKIGGARYFSEWAMHFPERAAWLVVEGNKVYEYLDSDLEKAVKENG